MNDKKYLCPFPGCEKGSFDTGSNQPWGASIYDKCPICDGKGYFTEEDVIAYSKVHPEVNPEWLRAEYEIEFITSEPINIGPPPKEVK